MVRVSMPRLAPQPPRKLGGFLLPPTTLNFSLTTALLCSLVANCGVDGRLRLPAAPCMPVAALPAPKSAVRQIGGVGVQDIPAVLRPSAITRHMKSMHSTVGDGQNINRAELSANFFLKLRADISHRHRPH
jgi:hypothetical protein